MMNFRDAWRAQYYLKFLQNSQEKIREQMESLRKIWTSLSIEEIIEQVLMQIGDELDKIILPTIVYEIELSKKEQKLIGNTPRERYESFFIQDNTWTLMSKAVVQKYPFLFTMIEQYVLSAVDNICQCIAALERDWLLLCEQWFNNFPGKLSRIRIAASDRHRNGRQAVIISFITGEQVVFKPTELLPDLLFKEFINILQLSPPYNLRCVRVIPLKEYGWLEYISHVPCYSQEEVSCYYRRAGVLLAVADALNYIDGHMDNLVAHGAYPVLIDLETLFHTFADTDSGIDERSILYTGLVEKPPKPESGRSFSAALQTPNVGRYEFLHPYALNDHTDELEVHFRGLSNEISHNCPMLKGQCQTVRYFIDDFIEGFNVGYTAVSNHGIQLFHNNSWWEKVKTVRVRQLIRHTLYYELLLKKIQQPQGCISRKLARNIIEPLLRSSFTTLQQVAKYETNDILNLNIPFFYHQPGNNDLYNADGECYSNYFECSATEEMRRHFLNRCTAYCERQVEILRNILPASPQVDINVNRIESSSSI